ncbi:MAG TPA: hypothetical protein VFH17_05375 [Coriobacteriia bacterium]|nr:hypothetical protein [Coriobacteriia bacterium]
MSQLSTSPAMIEMASTETLPIEVSFAANLGTATIASATASLTDLATGAAYSAGLGAPTNTTTAVTQTITALVAGHRYRLAVTVTDSSGRVWTSETTVACVF